MFYYNCGWRDNTSFYTKIYYVRNWILAVTGIKDIPKGTIEAVAMP
jgi:hypothetical protein